MVDRARLWIARFEREPEGMFDEAMDAVRTGLTDLTYSHDS